MAEPPFSEGDVHGPSPSPRDGTEDAGEPGLERRQRVHEVNNRLAALIMNIAFARATLAGRPPSEPLTPLERSDLATSLEHAEEAANQLAVVIRLLG